MEQENEKSLLSCFLEEKYKTSECAGDYNRILEMIISALHARGETLFSANAQTVVDAILSLSPKEKTFRKRLTVFRIFSKWLSSKGICFDFSEVKMPDLQAAKARIQEDAMVKLPDYQEAPLHWRLMAALYLDTRLSWEEIGCLRRQNITAKGLLINGKEICVSDRTRGLIGLYNRERHALGSEFLFASHGYRGWRTRQGLRAFIRKQRAKILAFETKPQAEDLILRNDPMEYACLM